MAVLLDCRQCNAMKTTLFETSLKCIKHSIQNENIFQIVLLKNRMYTPSPLPTLPKLGRLPKPLGLLGAIYATGVDDVTQQSLRGFIYSIIRY